MIKLVYDATVVGAALRTNKARTGVFRVVENVAAGLVASPECNVSFIAIDCVSETNSYFNSNEHFKSYSLRYPTERDELILQIKDLFKVKEKKISSKIGQVSTPDVLKQVYKLLRFGLYTTRKSFIPETGLHRLLKSADIYHSPFNSIPAEVHNNESIKKILTVYDLIPILFPSFFEEGYAKSVEHTINSIKSKGWAFCISQATKNDLCNSINIDPARVFVTHLAASAHIFWPCADIKQMQTVLSKYNIPSTPYFLSLCTLEPRKNVDRVIRCFARLIREQRLKEVNLVLVGTKGWDFNHIFNEVVSQGHVKERIIITGYVDDEDLAPLYSGALGFVYPSFYEGFGLPPLEAMQCGVPVITSNTSSLPEVVGDAGMMVDPTDEDALCQAMLRVYQSESLRKQMAEKSLEQAAKFSWEKCVQQTIHGYKMALNS